MRHNFNIASISLLATLLVGCASTEIQYTTSPKDPASPPDGGFSFGLRTASILLTSTQPAAEESSRAGGADGKTPPKPSAPKASTTSCVSPKEYKSSQTWWKDCLKTVSASVTPVTASDIVYAAVPHNSTFSRTSLTPKTSDADPLMLNSVAVNSTSKIPAAITSGGAGAVTGFAWGPWGAVAGGVIGIAGGLISGGRDAISQSPWWEQTCDWDNATQLAAYQAIKETPGASVTLGLPIALDYALATEGPNKAATKDGCWTSLPTTTIGAVSEDHLAPPSGWFYRFVVNQKNVPKLTKLPPVITRVDGITQFPESIKPAKDFFAKAGSTTKADSTFPASACRTVDLQVTWWQELSESSKDVNRTLSARTYSVVVADPTYVQVIKAPKQGTITLLPVCGGFASSGAPSNDVSDSITNLLKVVKDVKDAQSKTTKK